MTRGDSPTRPRSLAPSRRRSGARCAVVVACSTVAPLLAGVTGSAAAEAPGAAGPQIATFTPLSARPERVAQGNSGPVNRFAFDVEHFEPGDQSARVTCQYGASFAYRCPFEFDGVSGPRRRVLVDIPDLDRGSSVTIRFVTSGGERAASVTLVNRPQVVHEIESLVLPDGGRTTVDGAGRAAPVLDLTTVKSTTLPAVALSALAATPTCDQVYAVWVGANATDPVFPSAFGALNGAVIPSRPPTAGRPVREDSAPEWLITFPRAAQRVQFIAHYEVAYRVGECPSRIVRP
jgi:hypothetical protein